MARRPGNRAAGADAWRWQKDALPLEVVGIEDVRDEVTEEAGTGQVVPMPRGSSGSHL